MKYNVYKAEHERQGARTLTKLATVKDLDDAIELIKTEGFKLLDQEWRMIDMNHRADIALDSWCEPIPEIRPPYCGQDMEGLHTIDFIATIYKLTLSSR